eukprot:Blabericola_migrator_1__9788@NODE_536_length_7757_cov_263_784395_g64_i2_p4_GENE_NODE_536_length_7757_cov_263_784395_g64_i2NODE_536_length_7757_cov_263_784395_g64_i2_p4_ORF_typecomplete_len212_score27_18Reticulon/PF02453_17/4_5e14PRT_C/PF08372_10/5e02PRT_C/PF08372_10/0_0085Hum_adeno_E3A/PF05393_11/0_072RskA/PF10099_9/0_25RskA/PF10099_9/2_4e03_NODE_536_length_7757_cov_263_784395_g64_i256876322
MSSGNSETTATSGNTASSLTTTLRSQYARAASWENVYISSAVLCCVNLMYLLIYLVNAPAITLVAYLLAVVVLLGLPLSHVLSKRYNMSAKSEVVSEHTLVELAKQMQPTVNRIAVATREILYWTDTRQSLAACACLLACGYVLSRVSLPVLCLLAANVALVRDPAIKLYKQKLAKQIDPHLRTISAQVTGVLNRIPMLTDRVVDSKTKKI